MAWSGLQRIVQGRPAGWSVSLHLAGVAAGLTLDTRREGRLGSGGTGSSRSRSSLTNQWRPSMRCLCRFISRASASSARRSSRSLR